MPRRLGPIAAPPGPDLLGPRGAEIAPLFDRPFLVLHRASERYTARTCLLLLLDLGWEEALRRGASLDALCEGFPAQVRKPLAWMLPFLAAEGLLRREGETYVLDGRPDLDLAGLRAAAEAEAPGHGANFDLLDGVRTRIRPFFTEGKNGDELLFGLSLFPLWLAYFRNENRIYFPNNLLTLLALRDGLPLGARILEVGGGGGSFARLVAARAAEENWLGRIGEYRFTDVAPAFLRRAQRDLEAGAPGLPLVFQSLDLNRPCGDQGIAAESLDAIVGVNVVHAAQDLGATLRDLRSRLKPGGRLILGECLKPNLDAPLYLEFFFTFVASFTEVALDPDWRPRHGFLTPEAWAAALRHAGFASVDHLPPPRPLMDRHPAFTVGALTAFA
ncbi:class I SAM-dependent methyltransferase [Geothrix sp. 21YS21S-4]|uniref:class I SAM-dependent methyltransferase n=1 Tax=Geothrix sp. 21YS21S-4 TaxID=3068889 RepID=UPI0027B9E621|nr:class I SAM-dependent methyltransferase [Geothrix sp. 21YS21S-4]